MQFTFKNIDKDCNKIKHEPVGDIQPKFWFKNFKENKIVLVKRQQKLKVANNKPKSESYNHYGEYMAYILAQKAGIDSVPIELVTLHDTKNRYAKTLRLYQACSSELVLKKGESMYVGEVILGRYIYKGNINKVLNEKKVGTHSNRKSYISQQDPNDDINVILTGIATETARFERIVGKKTNEEIKEDIKTNISKMIDQVVFDCIFGNNDRHSNNWAGLYNEEEGTFKIYPAYDNERVMGLCKCKDEMRMIINGGKNLTDYHEREFFSRMGIFPAKSGISYKEMLNYLFDYYPEYAIASSEKILNNIDEDYLNEVYDGFKDISKRGTDTIELADSAELPESFRTFGLKMFSDRKAYVQDLLKKHDEMRENDSLKNIDIDNLISRIEFNPYTIIDSNRETDQTPETYTHQSGNHMDMDENDNLKYM